TESLLTQVAAIAVMRTRKRFFMSFPSPLLATLAIVIAILAVLLPFVPIVQSRFGFVSLPLPLLACIAGIVIVYVAGAEYAKHAFGILEPSDRKTPGFSRRRKSSLKPPAEHPNRDRKRHQPNE